MMETINVPDTSYKRAYRFRYDFEPSLYLDDMQENDPTELAQTFARDGPDPTIPWSNALSPNGNNRHWSANEAHANTYTTG